MGVTFTGFFTLTKVKTEEKNIDISGGNKLDWDSVLVQKKSLVEYTLSFYCEVLQFVLN